jgi:2-dehydro-3-deoxyphosphogluconate aldolase/(4S)-4-hydroxy-2-oxoglutarate aldolase
VGVGVGISVGDGLGSVGLGVGSAVWLGVGVGLGVGSVGVGLTVGLGSSVGVGAGVVVGPAVGLGSADGVGSGDGVGVGSSDGSGSEVGVGSSDGSGSEVGVRLGSGLSEVVGSALADGLGSCDGVRVGAGSLTVIVGPLCGCITPDSTVWVGSTVSSPGCTGNSGVVAVSGALGGKTAVGAMVGSWDAAPLSPKGEPVEPSLCSGLAVNVTAARGGATSTPASRQAPAASNTLAFAIRPPYAVIVPSRHAQDEDMFAHARQRGAVQAVGRPPRPGWRSGSHAESPPLLSLVRRVPAGEGCTGRVDSALLRSVGIGQDGYVPPTLPLSGRHQVMLGLPEVELDDLLPAAEVLAQEGFTTWVIAADALSDLPMLLSSFGRRVLIGVGGVERAEQVVEAAELGAGFVSADFLLPELVAVRPEFPVILGGFTPTELRAGLAAGAAAVQVLPAGAYRGEVNSLPTILGLPALIAGGTFTPDQARRWLDAGATAVWPRGLIGTELVTGATLGPLRSLVRDWRLND